MATAKKTTAKKTTAKEKTAKETTAKKAGAKESTKPTLSVEERAAMKEYIAEQKRQAAGSDGEADIREKLAGMSDEDRELGTKFQELVRSVSPDLVPRTWYGMPAYAKDGKVLCFFQNAGKFKVRYCTVGFQDTAALDDGTLWPTSYALTAWNATNEKKLTELLKQAFG
jgi:uncharacterized protein YdhG (YjbR/CyaY superfamily)